MEVGHETTAFGARFIVEEMKRKTGRPLVCPSFIVLNVLDHFWEFHWQKTVSSAGEASLMENYVINQKPNVGSRWC
jgi:hypothetical protein